MVWLADEFDNELQRLGSLRGIELREGLAAFFSRLSTTLPHAPVIHAVAARRDVCRALAITAEEFSRSLNEVSVAFNSVDGGGGVFAVARTGRPEMCFFDECIAIESGLKGLWATRTDEVMSACKSWCLSRKMLFSEEHFAKLLRRWLRTQLLTRPSVFGLESVDVKRVDALLKSLKLRTRKGIGVRRMFYRWIRLRPVGVA